MNGQQSKKNKRENAVNSVTEIPLAIIQAMNLLNTNDWNLTTADDQARLREWIHEACDLLDSVMTFIAGGKCDLGKLALTNGQQEYLRYVFERFAQGEEISADAPTPTVISMV